MREPIAFWQAPYIGDSNVTITEIDDFSARGMRRMYGRGDTFFDRPVFNMDIWRDRKDRLLARFWSRGNEVDWECWEILGVPDAHLLSGPPFDERWVPECLRLEYDTWILVNF